MLCRMPHLCCEHVYLSVTLVDCDHIVQKVEIRTCRIGWCLGYLHTEADPDRSILRSRFLLRKTSINNSNTCLMDYPVSQYQKGKTNLDILKQGIVSVCGISCAIFKSAPRPKQITMPAPHHSVFYRPYAFPATQPTASKHCRV